MGKVFNMTGGGGGSGIKLASIAIVTYPTKTTYTAGETFDPSGMVIEATYTNGATLEATGFSFTPSTPLTDGTTAVTIRYTEGGVTKTVDVPITVVHRLTGISVTQAPDKTVYEYGESFSAAGMVVTAEYSDGYTEAVTGYSYSPTGAFSALGEQAVTVTYSDGKHSASTTLTVTVERQTISAVPTQSGTLTYTGSSQSPTWEGYDSGKMTLGGDTSAIVAGNYEATFTPKDLYRWADGTTTAKTVAWSISRAVISAVPTQSGTVTYNGAEQGPAWSGYDADKLTIGGTVTGINAGSYTATFTPQDNYEWSDGTQTAKNATWTIGKAAGSISVSPTSLSLTASVKTGTITVTRTGDGAITATSSATGVATVSVSGTTVTVTGVASGSATVTIKVAAGTNHNATSKTVSVAVSFAPTVGTIYTLTSSGTWTAPVTGKYDIELHGGGGGGGAGAYDDVNVGSTAIGTGAGGGGSGELYEGVTLTGGKAYTYSIGSGGSGGTKNGYNGSDGGTTTFGDYSIAGGLGGGGGNIYGNAKSGYSSGTLGVSGTRGAFSSSLADGATVAGGNGGAGNNSNLAQLYGDGGPGGDASRQGLTMSFTAGSNGEDGAVLITYKGT